MKKIKRITLTIDVFEPDGDCAQTILDALEDRASDFNNICEAESKITEEWVEEEDHYYFSVQ